MEERRRGLFGILGDKYILTADELSRARENDCLRANLGYWKERDDGTAELVARPEEDELYALAELFQEILNSPIE